MKPERTCPDCGATLPADAPRGLCPNCLMGAALSQHVGPERPRRPAPSSRPAPASSTPSPRSIGPVPRVLLRDTAPGETPGPVVRPDADRRRPVDPLPHRRRDRPRRHGHRPQGPRPRPGTRRRHQGPAAPTSATTPTWSAASSRRRRSAASSSTRAWCRSTSWAPSPTAGRSSA